jgi:hypothetical protein
VADGQGEDEDPPADLNLTDFSSMFSTFPYHCLISYQELYMAVVLYLVPGLLSVISYSHL